MSAPGDAADPAPQHRHEVGALEIVVMVASAAVTCLVVGYLAWQAMSAPLDAAPIVRVLDTQTLPDGGTAVRVEVVNDGARGLVLVEVAMSCGERETSLVLENVPSRGAAAGTLACAAGEAPGKPRVASWVDA